MKIVIIEDDPATVETISLLFEMRWPGTTIMSTAKGEEGAELVERESPDMVILDLGLIDIDGIDVLREVRQFSEVPVLIISGRGEQTEKLKGLELGCDDYIVKPFDHMELLARVKAVLRRSYMPELRGEKRLVSIGDLAAHRVSLNGNPVSLTPTEWKLLSYLVQNEGRVVPQQVLAERVWGIETLNYASTIRSYISRLRAKIGDNPDAPRMILTTRGIGYRFLRNR